MLRELGYGVLFYLFAAAGAVTVGPLLFIGLSSSHEEDAAQLVMALVSGSMGGGALWLWIKYKYLTPIRR